MGDILDQYQHFSGFRLLEIGGVGVTIGGVFAAALVMVFFLIVSAVVGAALRRLRQRAPARSATFYLVEKVSTYTLTLLGLVAALSTLGLNLASIAVFAGGLGVGVGLGLQGVVKEFVSGLVLIFDRVLNIGDYIELESGIRGMVQEIGPRATRIRSNDNIDILVPNSRLIETAVTNWTLKGDTRRFHIPFTVAYGADKDKVREAVLSAARDVPFTLPDQENRKSQVWLVGFGDSSLNFELLVWPSLEAVKRPTAMNAAYTWAIDDALRKAGVEIPFPQRDIRVRGLFGEEGEDALSTLKLQRVHTPTASPPPATSTNDAADDLRNTPAPELPQEEAEEKSD